MCQIARHQCQLQSEASKAWQMQTDVTYLLYETRKASVKRQRDSTCLHNKSRNLALFVWCILWNVREKKKRLSRQAGKKSKLRAGGHPHNWVLRMTSTGPPLPMWHSMLPWRVPQSSKPVSFFLGGSCRRYVKWTAEIRTWLVGHN